MHLKLRDQQLKTSTYKYKLVYKNLMVTEKQQSIIDIHRKKKANITLKIVNKSKENRTKEEWEKKTYKNKSKTINKMAKGSYILIIILNVNRLNVSTKRHRLAE